MPKFKMEIDMSNAAFENLADQELNSLILKVANRVESGETSGRIMDTNGNGVGDFIISDEKDANDLNVQVQRMYRFETDRPLKAFVDIVVNDCLLIKGVRVMDGKKGLFVSMPREQAKDQKWYDTIRCLTQEIRDQVTEVVLSAYKEE